MTRSTTTTHRRRLTRGPCSDKQGSPAARHMLCEAAWVLVRTPGPLHAFYERLRARRGAQIALVATPES